MISAWHHHHVALERAPSWEGPTVFTHAHPSHSDAHTHHPFRDWSPLGPPCVEHPTEPPLFIGEEG